MDKTTTDQAHYAQWLATKSAEHDAKVLKLMAEHRESGHPFFVPYYYLAIQDRIPCTEIFNACLAAGVETNDGIENLKRGAKVIVDGCLQRIGELAKSVKKVKHKPWGNNLWGDAND